MRKTYSGVTSISAGCWADGRKVIMVVMDSASLAAVWKTAYATVWALHSVALQEVVAPGTGDGLRELDEEFKRHGIDPRTHSHIAKIV